MLRGNIQRRKESSYIGGVSKKKKKEKEEGKGKGSVQSMASSGA